MPSDFDVFRKGGRTHDLEKEFLSQPVTGQVRPNAETIASCDVSPSLSYKDAGLDGMGKFQVLGVSMKIPAPDVLGNGNTRRHPQALSNHVDYLVRVVPPLRFDGPCHAKPVRQPHED